MNIKKIIREEIKKLDESVESDLVLPKGKKVVLRADNPEVNRGLIVTWLEKGGYNVEYWYKDPSKIYPAEVKIDGESITKDGKIVYVGYHPKLDEATLKISQYKTSIKKLSHSQQDKLFDFLSKLKLMTPSDFMHFRDDRLYIAKSSITPKIKKFIERKFKIRLKESTNEATTSKMAGANNRTTLVPNEYVGKLGRVQYNLMKKLGYTRGGTHLIIADMHWGWNSRHRMKPNNQWSASILLKTHPYKMRRDNFGNFTGYDESDLLKGDVKKVLGELMRQLRANKLKLDGKPKFTGSTRHMPQIEFKVKPEQFKESVFAVNLDKEKNDERHPEQPNINYDPEKGKSRIRKIR